MNNIKLSTAREILTESLRNNNLFEIVFDEIPSATFREVAPQDLVDRVSFLVFNSTIPGAGGFENEWNIQVYADLDVFDLFTDWANFNFGATVSTQIKLYKQDGELLRTYKLNNVEIKGVDSIELDWENSCVTPTFGVHFKFGSIERL